MPRRVLHLADVRQVLEAHAAAYYNEEAERKVKTTLSLRRVSRTCSFMSSGIGRKNTIRSKMMVMALLT